MDHTCEAIRTTYKFTIPNDDLEIYRKIVTLNAPKKQYEIVEEPDIRAACTVVKISIPCGNLDVGEDSNLLEFQSFIRTALEKKGNPVA